MIETAKNEKGIALVVALVMLALLTILGTYALSTSSTELFITGNYRNSEYAFYAADAGIEWAKQAYTDPSYILPGSSTSCWPPPSTGKTCKEETKFKAPPSLALNSNESTEVNITWVRTGRPPAGYADDEWVADYYVITSQGTGPNNAKAALESMVVRMRSIAE